MVQGVYGAAEGSTMGALPESGGVPIFAERKETDMVQVLKGNIVQAPALGELQITEQGYLVLEDGVIRGV